MPNRILRDTTSSEAINTLSANAEVLFYRLIMKADDFGSYHGNVKLIRANLFPLKLDSIREADIVRWITECEKSGLIALYEIDGRKYLRILNFGQRLRNMRNKFPDPIEQLAATRSNTLPEEKIETKKKQETETKQKSLTLPWDSESFKNYWEIWKRYKKEQHRESYKSELTEQAALKKLCGLAGGSEDIALKIIEESISNSWKGLFPLKNNIQNGSGKVDRKQKFAEYFKGKSGESANAS